LGNLVDLLLPEHVNAVLRATIELRLTSLTATESEADEDTYYHRYVGEFSIRQAEYIIGLVGSKAHLDRLRDANAPIHELFVLAESDPAAGMSIQDLIDTYHIRLQYLDRRTSRFEDAAIERITDTTSVWQPVTNEDHFPLVLLRLNLPGDDPAREWQVRLTYQLPLSKREGFCFWTASRPTFVERVTINASQLHGVHDLRFERFLPNFDRSGTSDLPTDKVYSVTVANWVLKGHGVMLSWQG
jgi:hypothetical protein